MKLIPFSNLNALLPFVSAAAFLGLAVSTQAQNPQLASFTPQFTASQVGHLRDVRTTAYTHSEKSHSKWKLYNASGGQLTASVGYNSAAADWSRFPLGTTFRVVGEPTIYVVDDYGSALVGTDTIDIYCPSMDSMNQWATRHLRIEILQFGSYERSKKLLEGRADHAHCRAMLESIKRQGL